MTEQSARSFMVFLCHASEDKPQVRELHQRLTNEGIKAWLDEIDLAAGQHWEFEISEALRAADAILICLSQRSVAKEGFVQKEIKHAVEIAEEKPEDAIFLIPVRLDECRIPRRIAAIQYVDLYAPDGYRKLLTSLKLRAEALGRPISERRPTPAPAPDYELIYMLEEMLRDDMGLQKVQSRLAEREPDRNGWFHTEIRRQLQDIMRNQQHSVRERVQAGDALSWIEDSRFRADAWYLPAEKDLGFVEIPAGSFLMGSDPAPNSPGDRRAAPQHPVMLPAYFISRYAVTVAQYRAFLVDTRRADDLPGAGMDNHPLTSVTWQQAVEYCHWLTDKLRTWTDASSRIVRFLAGGDDPRVVTLPSEAEWERAARRIGNASEYPWGMQADPTLANYSASGLARTSAVGCFCGGETPDGLQDMSGNVWEWTRSNWGAQIGVPDFKYPYTPSDGREEMQTSDKMLKVIRGGSFYSAAEEIRCSHRGAAFPNKRYNHVGFRLVITTPAGR